MRRVAFLLIFGLAGTAVLVALGVWQMQRLTWKTGVLAEIDSRISGPAVALPADPDPARDRYLGVEVPGEILPGEVLVLVSRKQIGAGYRVIAPFLTDGGQRILLDRGFIRATDRETPRDTGPVTVTGNLDWPQEIDRFTPAPDLDAGVWFARDVPAMAQALNTDPVLLVARTDTGPDPMPVDSSGIPNDHLNYAITWFSLAAIWAAMTGYFLWRNRARTEGDRK